MQAACVGPYAGRRRLLRLLLCGATQVDGSVCCWSRAAGGFFLLSSREKRLAVKLFLGTVVRLLGQASVECMNIQGSYQHKIVIEIGLRQFRVGCWGGISVVCHACVRLGTPFGSFWHNTVCHNDVIVCFGA